ncbi:hypothetical protein PIB30_035647 [Stylosanthes scabra]|uniref:Uncharacterized protein n=1 Tax=Stylosanthes scabra TaxID=79078 RepID=A0ABU6QCL0_9FABA|nr:hypothetical protein [Stylosanthes scabra]
MGIYVVLQKLISGIGVCWHQLQLSSACFVDKQPPPCFHILACRRIQEGTASSKE